MPLLSSDSPAVTPANSPAGDHYGGQRWVAVGNSTQRDPTVAVEEALAAGKPLAWNSVMDPLHRLGERLRWSWGVVSHLNGVCNNTELREAHASQQAAVSADRAAVAAAKVSLSYNRIVAPSAGRAGAINVFHVIFG